MTKDFRILEEKIGYHFKNQKLLEHAITHKTYAYETNIPVEYNERLEFLGDSILGFIVAEELYRVNRYFSEGELTRRRSSLVNNKFLAKKANDIGLGSFLRLGKGETLQDGSKNPKNLANALEAIIGAVYLDSDLVLVKSFIMKNLFNDVDIF